MNAFPIASTHKSTAVQDDHVPPSMLTSALQNKQSSFAPILYHYVRGLKDHQECKSFNAVMLHHQ